MCTGGDQTRATASTGEPAEGLLLDVDYSCGVATASRPDGTCAELKFAAWPTSPIARAVHLLGLPYLVATTDRGEDIVVELPTPVDRAPLRGRPVVYLDQQTWSKLSLAQHQPTSLPDDERDAALWLIQLAEDWAVVLPYSNGTLTETTHWTDQERRRRLALTITTLSRGWQMLDPRALREAELRFVLAADRTTWPLPTVWTLDPGAASAARGVGVDAGEGLPPDLALTMRAASSTVAVLATILDPHPIERADPNRWAESWAELAAHVRETRKPAHLTAQAVHAAVLSDAGRQLDRAAASVGLRPEDLGTWAGGASRRDVGTLPALGLVREVITLKIHNSTARWVPNDLHDISYLVHAAGYADAVVGERGFVTLIQQAQRRLERPLNAHKTLHSLRESGLLDDARPAAPRAES